MRDNNVKHCMGQKHMCFPCVHVRLPLLPECNLQGACAPALRALWQRGGYSCVEAMFKNPPPLYDPYVDPCDRAY